MRETRFKHYEPTESAQGEHPEALCAEPGGPGTREEGSNPRKDNGKAQQTARGTRFKRYESRELAPEHRPAPSGPRSAGAAHGPDSRGHTPTARELAAEEFRALRAIEAHMDALERGAEAPPRNVLEREWNGGSSQHERDQAIARIDITQRHRIQSWRGFATLCAESLACLLNHTEGRRIVDCGAGGGHLVRVLRAHGRECVGLDTDHGGYVERVGAEIIREDIPGWLARERRDDDAILLCWPPSNSADVDRFAESALDALGHGNLLLYIGEAELGCTGTERFHERLASELEELERAPVAPMVAYAAHDELSVWRPRRAHARH